MASRRLTRALPVILFLGMLLFVTGCRAAGTPEPSPNEHSSADLVEAPKEFDGTDVTFRGEVIGEAMVRGEMAWIHVNDDPYYMKNVEEEAQLGGYNSGMAIWLPAGETETITYFGDYKHEGDIFEIEGVFNSACGEHGGDTDIHATTLTIIQAGHVVVDQIKPGKVVWAIALAFLALALYLINRYWQRGSESHRR
jgi:hypothetical protein